MNLPDSFYIALCMTVLLLCIVYWFWSQNQFLLRKMNLLENIVYELKTICSNPPSPASIHLEPAHYAPPPSSVVGEDEVEELHDEFLKEEEEQALHPLQRPPTPPTPPSSQEDLQPGGVGSGIKDLIEPSNALEGMTLKELRRLGEQRGIKGASDMKKRELLANLRAGVSPPPSSSVLDAFEPESIEAVELSS
jgi:hypothetical protein